MAIDKECPLLDQTVPGQGAAKRLICYANGRLLGRKWLTDYCIRDSNIGHEECPILNGGGGMKYYARLSESEK